MNVSVRSLPLLFIPLVVAGLISAPSLQAQSVATAPVGYMQNTLPPSTDGTNRNFSVVSFPLHQPAVFSGTVSSVSADTLTFSGTIPTGLTATPYMVHVSSAANSIGTGQSYLITASSSNSVTVADNGTQLQSLLAVGDSVLIRAAETLSSVFGSIVSGSSTVQLKSAINPNDADIIYVWNGTGYNSYYFYTGYYWVNAADGGYANQNNLIIYPDEAVLVGRISKNTLPSTYAMTIGTVPTNTQTAVLNVPGYTYVSNPLPTPISFSQFGFTSAPSWQTGTNPNDADLVYVWQNNSWQAYYFYTGNYWVLASDGGYANQNNTTIPAGSGVLVLRRGTASSPNNYVATPLNYTLN